jgi:hypothetical protein
MKRLLPAALVLTLFLIPFSLVAHAQEEGLVPTQALVKIDSKSTPPANASALTVSVNDHKEPLTSWAPVVPANAQVALLIDDGLRESMGRELDNLRNFVRTLPPGVEILVGYMQYGSVVQDQPFTTDHVLAATTLHLPQGMPGMSASPYLCISDFVKKWPSSADSSSSSGMGMSSPRKARFIVMITDGVDPYNGSTSINNQDSPYVATAVTDAQRAGVAVYAIYFPDAGIRGGRADFSGQSYLQQITEATGGVNLWEGVGSPVSTAPFLSIFQRALGETYVATFNAPASSKPERDLVRVKFSAPKVKLHAPEAVRVGNLE